MVILELVNSDTNYVVMNFNVIWYAFVHLKAWLVSHKAKRLKQIRYFSNIAGTRPDEHVQVSFQWGKIDGKMCLCVF